MKFAPQIQKKTTSSSKNSQSFFGRNIKNEPFFRPSHLNSPAIQMEKDETKSFTENEKLMKVYSKVKESKQFKTMTKGFEGGKSHLDLELTAVENIEGAAADTSLKNNKVTIRFSNSYVKRASEISIARTIHHELHHAIHNLHLKRADSKVSPENYPGIYDYYTRFHEKGRDWNHNLMAAHSRGDIIEGIKQFDTDEEGVKKDRSGSIYVSSLKKTMKYSDSEFYEAMSWKGLTHEQSNKDDEKAIKTEAWKIFEKDNPEKAAMYQAIFRNEASLFKEKVIELPPIEIKGDVAK